MTSEIRTNSLKSRAGLSTVTLTDSGPMFSGITTFVDNSGFNIGTGSSIFSPATNTLTFGTNSNERLRIKSNGQIVLGSDGTNSEITFTQDGTSGTQLNATTTGSGGYNTLSINSATFIHKYGSNERLRIDSNGKVIVGNDGTAYGNGSVQSFIAHTANAGTSGFNSIDTTSVAAGVGGEISFYGKYNTGAQDYAYLGHIRGIKENATAGNTACALAFHTRPNATVPQERLRIKSNGYIGIGNTNPQHVLHVTSAAGAVSGQFTDGTNSTIQIKHPATGDAQIGAFTGQNLILAANNQEKLRIKSDGTVIFVNKLTNSASFTTHNTNFYGGDVNTGGVRIEVAHSTTTVSGNTAQGSFPHHLNLTNYSKQGSADNGQITIGFDIPTTSSHANGAIAYQATGVGQGDFSFHTETGNAIYERLRIKSDGRVDIGGFADSSSKLGINGSSTAELSNSSGLYNQTNPCFLQIKNASDGINDPECGIIFQPRNSGNGAVAIYAKRTGTYTSDLIYRNRTGANSSLERLRITPTGKLQLSNSDGIQLSPQTSSTYAIDGTLSYYSTSNGVYLNGAGTSGWLRLNAAGTENNHCSMNFYGSSYGFGSGGQIDLRTSNTERFRITNGGEVTLGPDANTAPATTLHVRSQGDVSSTLGGAPAGIMIEAVTNNSWASGEAGAELLFKKGGDITAAIRAEHDRGGGDHTYEDCGLAFYTAPASESPTATRKFRVLSTGNADLTGTLSEGSDIRLKTDINNITGALGKLNQIRGVEYKWNSVAEDNCGIRNREDGLKEIGVIADEIESIIPQVVKSDTVKGLDGTEYKGVSYDRLIPILIEAVKEQQKQIETLEQENITLRVRVTNLES